MGGVTRIAAEGRLSPSNARRYGDRGNGGRFVNRPYGQGRPSVGAGPRTARSYFPVRPNFRAVEGASPYEGDEGDVFRPHSL